MKNLFFLADTHFGHEDILKFTVGGTEEKLRAFSCIEEHDEFIIENWNNTVKPGDHVYHLGDVAIAKRHLQTVKRLNGKKRLVMGNHDIYEVEKYREAGFQKVMAYRVFEGWIFSHIPIYAAGMGRFEGNIHGHLHSEVVTCHDSKGYLFPASKYHSVCCEKVAYTPVSFDSIVTK